MVVFIISILLGASGWAYMRLRVPMAVSCMLRLKPPVIMVSMVSRVDVFILMLKSPFRHSRVSVWLLWMVAHTSSTR